MATSRPKAESRTSSSLPRERPRSGGVCAATQQPGRLHESGAPRCASCDSRSSDIGCRAHGTGSAVESGARAGCEPDLGSSKGSVRSWRRSPWAWRAASANLLPPWAGLNVVPRLRQREVRLSKALQATETLRDQAPRGPGSHCGPPLRLHAWPGHRRSRCAYSEQLGERHEDAAFRCAPPPVLTPTVHGRRLPHRCVVPYHGRCRHGPP